MGAAAPNARVGGRCWVSGISGRINGEDEAVALPLAEGEGWGEGD
jgi:hypothetical protein